MTEGERLQKILARAGIGSRRAAETMIAAGRVTVDGRVAKLGDRADAELQRIEVDGHPIGRPERDRAIMLHKPSGYVVTRRDERDRPTVFDLIAEAPARLRYVGRLDQDSEGLLLLATDGELVHRLTHPRYEVAKEYEATVRGVPSDAALERLRSGIELEDGRTAPAEVERLHDERKGQRIRLLIHEGRKRQVRRMLEAVGHPVTRLVRTAVGPIRLGDLPPGRWRPLSAQEVHALRRLVGLEE